MPGTGHAPSLMVTTNENDPPLPAGAVHEKLPVKGLDPDEEKVEPVSTEVMLVVILKLSPALGSLKTASNEKFCPSHISIVKLPV